MMERAARHIAEGAAFDQGHGDRGQHAPVVASFPGEDGRDARICGRYAAGETLSSIAMALGLSIEGVRKIARRYGLDKTNAGLAVRKLASLRPRKAKPAWERVYGCSLLEYSAATYEERMAFLQHRTNAKRKRIAWSLTLAEWTLLWRDSGKWGARGQGPRKYGMTRIDPALGLVAGNVRIDRNAEALRRAQARHRPMEKMEARTFPSQAVPVGSRAGR